MNPSQTWEAEARRVLIKHVRDPRYPKPLKAIELIHQVEQLDDKFFRDVVLNNQKRYDADAAGLRSSNGVLTSASDWLRQIFVEYIWNCDSASWSSWKSAWVDFQEYETIQESYAVKRALAESEIPIGEILEKAE